MLEDESAALLLLGLLDLEYSEALVGELVSASLSHRNALRIRLALGRLPHDQAERIVPPAVWRQLRRRVIMTPTGGWPSCSRI